MRDLAQDDAGLLLVDPRQRRKRRLISAIGAGVFSVVMLATAALITVEHRRGELSLVQQLAAKAVKCQQMRKHPLDTCWADPALMELPRYARLMAQGDALRFALYDQLPGAREFVLAQLVAAQTARRERLWEAAMAFNWAADDTEAYLQTMLDASAATAAAISRARQQPPAARPAAPRPRLSI